jgi:methylphosphotriester-DNA--protein-cysteine methyltransferase
MGARDELCPCVSSRSSELTIVLDGVVVLEIGPAKQTVHVRAGDATLVPRGMAHGVRVLEGGRALLVDVESPFEDHGPRVLSGRLLPSKVLGAVGRGWTHRAEEVLAPALAAAQEVMLRMASRAPLTIETTTATARMQLAKQLIEDRFTDPPSLSELARAVRTNSFYLLRGFKKEFGFTPLAYAQFLRTEHFFWELLGTRTPRTLLRLSSEAGFRDYSSFERRIRETYGRPPSALLDHDEDARFGP